MFLKIFLVLIILFQGKFSPLDLNLKKEFSKGKIEIIFNGIGLKEFYSIQFDLVYSPKELKFIKIEKGPLAKDALFEENHKIDGLVKVALAS